MIFKSKFPKLDIPNIDLPQYCFMEGKRRYCQSRNRLDFAIRDAITGKSMDIYEIESMSIQFASGLVNILGFKKDEVVALFSPNSIYFPIVSFGTMMAGGSITLANHTYTSRELLHQLADSNTKVIATESGLLDTVLKAIKMGNLDIPISKIILIDINPTHTKHGATHIEHFYSNAPVSISRIESKTDAETRVAAIPYSSGTTGVAKGVMLTHKNLITAVIMNSCFSVYDNWFDRKNNPPVYICALPFYHIYGFNSILNLGIANSIGIIVMQRFQIESFLSHIEQYKAEFVNLVPPLVTQISKYPNITNYNLSSIKAIRTGSAPTGKDSLARFYSIFKNIGVVRAYGLTETSPTVVQTLKNHPNDGSSGTLHSNVEAKVVDIDGNQLGYNQVGELCFRGPSIMKGYLNNPEANAKSFDSENFFHTGDIGFVDEKENFHITGRIKELIKYKGFQVPPAELEGLLLKNDNVADSAVIGVYDGEQDTELPKAYIVLASKHSHLSKIKKDQIAQEAKAWLETQVAPHKKLRGGISVIDEIPKNPSGKILRHILKDMDTENASTIHKSKL
ncbi:hypothetical protein BB560_006660 [Smittium megazygosporum]|uniref:AMP-dependent synthetase/ligase domain-containing protein n=1 Tax=Smittium megazygosporum TaxID=133381 RepID=A0A2T9Y2K5_9FUNG|nr:hypothetical protein BB560_006660 [Smittium megazygosporum]